MFKWFSGLFKREKIGMCGGVGCMEIVKSLGKKTGCEIYYRRPTSEEVLSYNYQNEDMISEDSNLRQYAKTKNTLNKMALHMVDNLYIPSAEKIFSHTKGFVVDGKDIQSKSSQEQFNLIKKYYSYHLIELCTIAFAITTKGKKKV